MRYFSFVFVITLGLTGFSNPSFSKELSKDAIANRENSVKQNLNAEIERLQSQVDKLEKAQADQLHGKWTKLYNPKIKKYQGCNFVSEDIEGLTILFRELPEELCL